VDNRAHINNSGSIGVLSPGGQVDVAGGMHFSQRERSVEEQHSYFAPLPKVPDVPPSGPGGADNRNAIGQERDQMLLALANAIIQLQGPARAILQALAGQDADQIPGISVQPPSDFATAATATIASVAMSYPMVTTGVPSRSVSPASTPSSLAYSPPLSTDTGVGNSRSTASLPGSQKRKSRLGKIFGKD